MGSIFSKPKAPRIEPVVTQDDARVKAAAALEAEQMSKRRKGGFWGTILTSPTGLGSEPTVEKKKLGA